MSASLSLTYTDTCVCASVHTNLKASHVAFIKYLLLHCFLSGTLRFFKVIAHLIIKTVCEGCHYFNFITEERVLQK